MDVVVHFPASWQTSLVDVTIRCPHGVKQSPSDKTPAHAAMGGESDKARRYGNGVLPLAFETYGRLGPLSLLTLQTLADAAAVAGQVNTRRLTGWRRHLERAVIWSGAESTLLAYGSAARTAFYRNAGDG